MDRAQLEDLLSSVVRANAESLHLMPDQSPFMRVDGTLVVIKTGPISAQVVHDMMRDFLFEDHRARLSQGAEVEILYSTASGQRFRTMVSRQRRGLNVVFRRMSNEIPTFEELGLPPVLGGMTSFRRGIVFLAGFVGSGTSTTLASLVDTLNRVGASHIATVEESIEYFHQPKQSLVHQCEVDSHTASMAQGIRDAYRLGAEILAIDGLRDYESLCAALEAVERGLLVFATFRSSSVVGALRDIVRLAPVDERAMLQFRLAKLTRGVTAQSLMDHATEAGRRVPVFEVLIRTRSIAKAIRDGRFDDLNGLTVKGRGLGMQTSDLALRQLLAAGSISVGDASLHATDREWVTSRS